MVALFRLASETQVKRHYTNYDLECPCCGAMGAYGVEGFADGQRLECECDGYVSGGPTKQWYIVADECECGAGESEECWLQ